MSGCSTSTEVGARRATVSGPLDGSVSDAGHAQRYHSRETHIWQPAGSRWCHRHQCWCSQGLSIENGVQFWSFNCDADLWPLSTHELQPWVLATLSYTLTFMLTFYLWFRYGCDLTFDHQLLPLIVSDLHTWLLPWPFIFFKKKNCHLTNHLYLCSFL